MQRPELVPSSPFTREYQVWAQAAQGEGDGGQSAIDQVLADHFMMDIVLSVIEEFRAEGIGVSLDDFGTGFSSLSQLRSFPFDHLKIDRSFVRDVTDRSDLQAIIHGITTLARGMGMQTTAEGVETPDQLAVVRRLGCHAIQGFLLGMPMAAEAIGRLARRST